MTLLILGSFVSSLGSSAYFIAITFYILEKFENPLILGVVATAGTLPQLIFGFFAGQITDKLNKKKFIVFADILRGLLMFLLLAFIYFNKINSSILIIFSFVFSTIGVFFRPSIASIIPLLTKKEDLNKANSMLHISSSITVIVGPILGGMAYSYLGIIAVILIDGFSYIFSGISELFIGYEKEVRKKFKIKIKEEIVSGINIIFSSKTLKTLIIFTLISNFFFISFFELILPYLVKTEISQTAAFYGKLSTMRAGGTILGASLVYLMPNPKNFFNRYIKLVTFQGLMLISTGLLAILSKSIPSSVMVLYFALFLVGLISSTINIPFDVLIQANAPEGKVGTVFSTMSTLFRCLAPLTLFTYGFFMKYFDSSVLSIFNGSMVIILSIILLILTQKKGEA